MIITKHAVHRLKDHGLIPKSTSGPRAKEFARRSLRDRMVKTKKNYQTGALIYITKDFQAVGYGQRIITVYPLDKELDGKVLDSNG